MRMTVILDTETNPLKGVGVDVGPDSIAANLSQRQVMSVGGDLSTNFAMVGFTDGTQIYFVVDEKGPRITVIPGSINKFR